MYGRLNNPKRVAIQMFTLVVVVTGVYWVTDPYITTARGNVVAAFTATFASMAASEAALTRWYDE